MGSEGRGKGHAARASHIEAASTKAARGIRGSKAKRVSV